MNAGVTGSTPAGNYTGNNTEADNGKSAKSSPSLKGETRTKAYLGIDLGGTKLHALVADAQGRILLRKRASTPSEGGNKQISSAIIDIAEDMLAEAEAENIEILSIGVGSPGFISEDGTIEDASNLGIINLPLGEMLREYFKRPSLVLHDVKAAVLGEATFGSAKGMRNVAYLNMGTGVSVGLLLDGRVHQGARGRSGELGHIQIRKDGPLCSCGRRGCIEVYISGPALERRASEALAMTSEGSILRSAADTTGRIPARAIAEAANDGDALAQRLLRETAEYVARTAGALDNVLDLKCVIVGGGLANLGEAWFEMIRSAVDNYLLEDDEERMRVVAASLGDDTGAMGVIAGLICPKQAH